MRLQLTRPIIFLDIEATGVDPQTDRIIEISLCTLQTDGSIHTKTKRVNPQMPIPPASTEVHHITDQDVEMSPTFGQIAKSLHQFIQGSDLAGFNSNRYDFPMLNAEFYRAGIEWRYWQHRMVDVGNLFKIMEPRTLEAAVQFYLGTAHEGAHGAEADTEATARVLLAQLDKYPDLPVTVDDLALASNYGAPILDLSGKFTAAEDGTILLNFGKYRGEPASDHPDFLEWMLYRASFPPDTCRIASEVLQRTHGEDGDDPADDGDYLGQDGRKII